MPKSVALEDDSLFILSGYFNGVSHPPGYPIYTFIVYLFTHLPVWGGVAAKAHGSSAFFGALTIGVLYLLFIFIGLKRIYSALLAVTFSVSGTFWSQAIITEVYTLNCFLNLCALYIALTVLKNLETPSSDNSNYRLLCLLAVVLGLALANHWPLTMLAFPAYLLMSYHAFKLQTNKKTIVLLFLVCSSVPYIAMYFNNQGSPEINFSGKFQDFSDFIGFVLRHHYAVVDNQDTAGWIDKLNFTKDFLIQIAKELNLLLLFAGIGCVSLFKNVNSRRLLLAFIWLFLSNGLVLIMLLNFDYGVLYSSVFKVYPIVSIVSLFVLSAYGLKSLSMFPGETQVSEQKITAVIILSLIVNLWFSLPSNYRDNYIWAEAYANRILDDVPKGAVLFADGDIELGLISYLHKIQKVRPDLEIYSPSALLLNKRLYVYNLNNKKEFIDSIVTDNPEENYYVSGNHHKLSTVEGSIFALKLGPGDNKPRVSITEEDIKLIIQWSHSEDVSDPWTKFAIQGIRQVAIRVITNALKEAGSSQQERYLINRLEELVITDSDRLVFLSALKKEVKIESGDYYVRQLSGIRRDGLESKQDIAHFIYLSKIISVNNPTEDLDKNARFEACQSWETIKNDYCSND